MNNKIFTHIVVVFLMLPILGCSTYFKRSIDTVENKKTQETLATVIVWANDTNAAIVNNNGNVCMQNALALKTTETTANVNLSDALLKLSKVVSEKKNGEAPDKDLLAVTASINQAATLLTTTTERTAFLNTGMFYLCQILSNSSIEATNAQDLIDTLITSSSGIK
jgi:hypothetical protein